MTCTTNAAARKFHGGASHTAPNPTPQKGVTAIMLRIRLRRYRDALGEKYSAAGATSHLVRSSSASRLTAGAAGFLLLIQCRDRPERWGELRRFDTMPSSPSLQAWVIAVKFDRVEGRTRGFASGLVPTKTGQEPTLPLNV
jgi:hypothetical protein